jgi:hypothetical protein
MLAGSSEFLEREERQVRKLKSIIIALIALAFIVWLYDHYLKRGAVDITLVRKEEGKILYCRHCEQEMSRDVQLVSVSRREASKHYVIREQSVCADCRAKGLR